MFQKSHKIIILSILSVIFAVLMVAGVFLQAYFADVNVIVSAEDFAIVIDSQGNNYSYIPYGINAPKTKGDVEVITVNTGNASVIIETPDRVNVSNNNGPARLICVNGEGTKYVEGLYNGNCEIKEYNDLRISSKQESYEITLAEVDGLFEMDYEDSWLLLSLDNDKSLLRTYAGIELSKMMGNNYSPDIRFVEVFVNGMYSGTYILCEKVKMAYGRIAIDSAKNGIMVGEGVTGGYLMYTDTSVNVKSELTSPTQGKNFYFTMSNINILPGATERSRIAFRQTKNLLDVHFKYIRKYMTDAENALFSENFKAGSGGFRDYFNVTGTMDWYIIEELFKNPNDPTLTSTYMYKERNGKITIGPVWYFGFSSGNSDYKAATEIENWYVRNNVWISRMFEDEGFEAEFKARWQSVSNIVSEKLFEIIDSKAEELIACAALNGMSKEEYKAEVESLKLWLNERISWINNNI